MRLLAFARSGDVEFRYSSAHICEMAPVAPGATENAIARTRLLVELCGSRCFRSFPSILEEEKAVFSAGPGTLAITTSDVGDWFPSIDEIFDPLSTMQGLQKSELQDAADSIGSNRKLRRLIAKRSIKEGALRSSMEQSLLKGAKNSIQEVLRSYPMREDHALTLWRFVIGKASEAQAKAAFLASLRDPIWMTRWFTNHFDKMTPVGRWLREPSEKFHETLSEVRGAAQIVRRLYAEGGLDFNNIPGIDDMRTAKSREDFFLRVFGRLGFQGATGENLTSYDLKALRQAAPGLSTMIEVAMAIGWSSISRSSRNPLESDFVDVAHAMHAPYVDVFRADAYMAPLIQRAVNPWGTKVVGKLREVVTSIEAGLAERQLTLPG